MIFTNRFDKVELVDSVDDTAFSRLTYSYKGTKQNIDATISQIVPESRYIIIENMLFSVTDYEQSRTETRLTAVDFVHMIAETKTLSAKTYSLLELLRLVNKNATVALSGVTMPTIDVNDGTSLISAIDDLVAYTSAYITIETFIDFSDVTLYNVRANVIAINPDMFNKVDEVVLIDDVNSVKHFNPQLDLSKRIRFGFTDINDKDKLKTWLGKISQSDYDEIVAKIDGADPAISEIEAHNILANAIEFKKSVFTKQKGQTMINNDIDMVDDGIPYDLGDVAFGSYNQVVSNIINTLLSEFRQVDYPPMTLSGDLKQYRLIGVDGNMLYRATELEFNLKRRRASKIVMLLADYFKETK